MTPPNPATALQLHRGVPWAGSLYLVVSWHKSPRRFMGIEVIYRRLPKKEFERLLSNPDEGEAFLCASLPGFDTDTLMALVQDPDALHAKGPEILAAFEKRNEDPTRVDLQKDWQALHFLLTGDSSTDTEHRPDEPLHNVVMGGHETTLETGYGPVRMFDIEDVQAISSELAKVSVDELRARFSAEAFNEEEIYPCPRPGGWDKDEIEGVFQVFPKLVRFFQDAVDSSEIVVVYAT